jgi:4-carboxymuconolactone decarboxylase
MSHRLPAFSNYTPEQIAANAEFKARRGRDVFGPYVPLHHSPDLMNDVEAVGRRLRYHSVFPENLKEMAILMVARHMNQPYEWSVHQPIAVKFGVSEAVCAAIEQGVRPAQLSPEETLIYNAMDELLTQKHWSDATFAAVKAVYGERGCVELPALIGIYTLLAYVLNVAGTPPEAGAMAFKKTALKGE